MLAYPLAIDYGLWSFFNFFSKVGVIVTSCVTFSEMWMLPVWEFFDVGVDAKICFSSTTSLLYNSLLMSRHIYVVCILQTV